MSWDLTSDRPIYAQIVEKMQLRIYSGVYPIGSKLPSVRDLALEASVNPNTMQRALSILDESGLIYSVRTSGRYVTEDTDVIREAKRSLAKEYIKDFLNNMSSLGFEKESIVEMIDEMTKELKI